jgi:hypothetical protein
VANILAYYGAELIRVERRLMIKVPQLNAHWLKREFLSLPIFTNMLEV